MSSTPRAHAHPIDAAWPAPEDRSGRQGPWAPQADDTLWHNGVAPETPAPLGCPSHTCARPIVVGTECIDPKTGAALAPVPGGTRLTCSAARDLRALLWLLLGALAAAIVWAVYSKHHRARSSFKPYIGGATARDRLAAYLSRCE